MIANRPNDNIGLVAFAGESFTQCPTTTDHITLLNLLNELNTRMMEDGTAIGLGIATGINTLRESKTKSKVMILLTDGSNNSGDITPTVAAQIAKEKGIRIYTVAVGTHGKAKYPIETSLGTRYIEQEVTIDEATLRSIAQTTGGAYYRATDNRSLEEIYRKIDGLEKTKLTTKSFSAYEELYRPWALYAFLLLLLAYILRNTLIRTNP
jgi:Ca-activated chloride channel family protein